MAHTCLPSSRSSGAYWPQEMKTVFRLSGMQFTLSNQVQFFRTSKSQSNVEYRCATLLRKLTKGFVNLVWFDSETSSKKVAKFVITSKFNRGYRSATPRIGRKNNGISLS